MTGPRRDSGGAPGPLAVAVAAEIRAALGRRGWRQADLARALDVAEGWVSNRVRVEAKTTLDLNDLEAIAAALAVPACTLVPAVAAYGLTPDEVRDLDDTAGIVMTTRTIDPTGICGRPVDGSICRRPPHADWCCDAAPLHPVDALPMCGQRTGFGYCARAPHGAEHPHIEEYGDRVAPHRFVESGPGQEPTTVSGLIVCPSCYLPRRHLVHV